MASRPNRDLTDEPSAPSLGGFAEAGSIEPGVGDQAADAIRTSDVDVPRAPSSPFDEPAVDGPLNPA